MAIDSMDTEAPNHSVLPSLCDREQLKKGALVFCLLFLLSGSIRLYSKNFYQSDFIYEVKKVEIGDDLFQNIITCLARDQNGIIWAGTRKGLYRYDGYSSSFVPLLESNYKEQTLTIHDLIYENGILYVASDRGLFGIQTMDSRPVTLPWARTGAGEGNVMRVAFDSATGWWWLLSNGRLFNYHQNQLRNIKLPVRTRTNKPSLVFEKGRLWVFADMEGLFCVQQTSLQFKGPIFMPDMNSFNQIFTGSDGNLYALYDNKLLRVNETGVVFPAVKSFPKTAGEESMEEILNAEPGIFCIARNMNIRHFYQKEGKQAESVIPVDSENPKAINHLYFFDDKLYGASTAGIVIVAFRKNLFTLLQPTFSAGNKILEVPRGICENDRYIYLFSYNHIYRTDKRTNNTETINQDRAPSRGVLLDHDTIWIASEGHGLYKWLVRSNKLMKVPMKDFQHQKSLICIARPDAWRLYLGGYSYLLQYDKRTASFTSIPISYPQGYGNNHQINQMLVLNDHELLLATSGGVFKINDQGQVLRHYTASIRGKDATNATSIWKASDGTLWVGTFDGLIHLSETGILLHHFKPINGLAGSIVVSLMPDARHRLWAATYTGLSAIDLNSYSIENFYKENGLPDNEFNHTSFASLRNGDLVLGTVSGFVRFNPMVTSVPLDAPVHLQISKLESGNQLSKSTALGFLNDTNYIIRVGKGTHFVQLHFFLSPIQPFGKAEFQYKIAGIHPDWISMGSVPVLNIDNFKKGTYQLTVRAMLDRGSNHVVTRSFPLVVEQYFYYDTWFYLMLVGSILLLVYLYFQSQLSENRKLQALRQDISRDLHDEMGGYLTAITMNAELSQMHTRHPSKYAHAIASLSKKALISLKENLWSLDGKTDTAVLFWDYIKSLATETLEPLGIQTSFSEIQDLDKIRLTVQYKRCLLLVIKECMTNAIKYGDRKTISFSWQKEGQVHQIVISNPKGLQLSTQESPGHGLRNIQSRMSQVKGSAAIISNESLFTVVLNIGKLS